MSTAAGERFLLETGLPFLRAAQDAGLDGPGMVWVCATMAGMVAAHFSPPGGDEETVKAAAEIMRRAIGSSRKVPGGPMETVQ